MAKNSLIDNEFEDESDFSNMGSTPEDKAAIDELKNSSFTPRIDFPEPSDPLDNLSGRKDRKNDIEVEVVSDTPDKDRGKWVADDARDGLPDIPDENEVRQYSKDVQKRINSLTARVHAERRAAEEKDRIANEAIAAAKKILQENNSLKEIIESGEKTLIGEHKGRLESQLASAKTAFREAHEAGDVNGQLAAQENIAKIVSQMDRLSAYRPQTLPRDNEAEFEKRFTPAQQAVQPSQQAVAWKDRNSWFGTPGNEAMTTYAFGLHQQIVGEGVQPDTKAYYEKIDSEMQKRFPEKFSRNERSYQAPRRTGSVVAPATRTAAAQPRTVQITESQARLARRLGLTVQQYAQQLLAEQGQDNGKDYTHFS